MADEKKPKKKDGPGEKKSSGSKPKAEAKPPAGPALPPGGPDPMATGAGVPPPMPGQGIDPYAALAGMISTTPPPGQPGLGTGMGGMAMPGGGMGGGMGMGLGGGGGMMSEPLQGGQPTDPISHALTSSGMPMSFPPDMAEHAIDPSEMAQQNMSLEQLLTLLSMMQAGMPNSGLTPPARPGSTATGMLPLNGGML